MGPRCCLSFSLSLQLSIEWGEGRLSGQMGMGMAGESLSQRERDSNH